jgi:hypothetical protein
MRTNHCIHVFSVLVIAGCGIAKMRGQTSFRIAGTVTTEDSRSPLGATVVISKTPDYVNVSRTKLPRFQVVASSTRVPQTVAVSSTGAFEATGLPRGQYQLCAVAPDGYLDNCAWFGPVDVILAPGSANTVKNIVLRRGAVVRIRLDDPQSLLPAVETPAGERRAKIGVMADGALRPAVLRSRDSTGQNLIITVPFDKPLRLWVSPSQVAVRGPDGTTFFRAGPIATFQASRLAGDINFHLQVVPGVAR